MAAFTIKMKHVANVENYSISTLVMNARHLTGNLPNNTGSHNTPVQGLYNRVVYEYCISSNLN